MRIKFTLFFLVIYGYSNAQIQNLKELAFDLTTLVKQQTYSLDSIIPKFKNDKFFYFNSNNHKIFESGFQEAYPFIGKSALVKKNGKYGIIDTKGKYIIQPIYENYVLPPYEHEANLIIFEKDFIFDLNLGLKSKNGYTICKEPAVPSFKPFAEKANKYGLKNYSDEIIIKAKYDSIIDIHFDFFIVKLNNKIGIIDNKDKVLIPFEYEDLTFSRGMYYSTPETIGLKKEESWSYFNIGDKKETKILCKSIFLLNPDGTSTLYYE